MTGGDGVTLPLAGVRVIDLSTALAGPLTSQLLGDLGADVVKVEAPGGDGYRGRLYVETDATEGANPRFDCANRNKRSLVVDAKSADGFEVVERLIRWTDVLVENMRPGVPERLGFGVDRCHELNPRLIFASLTGWGETGPWARRSGADIWAQALGGTVAVQGSPGEPPLLGGTAFVDHGAPLALAFGITVALLQRERTGRGCEVNTSLLETALYMQSSSSFTDYLNGGELVVKGGRGWSAGFPMGAYPAADGDLVTMMVSDEQWDTFLRVLGLEALRGLEAYDTQEKRVAARHELYPLLDEAFRKRTRAEWAEAFAATGLIRADPALRYDEVVTHPQVEATGSVITTPHPVLGLSMAVAGPVVVDGVRSDVRLGPPSLGQHTRDVLAELGYTPSDIDGLLASGATREDQMAGPADRAAREAYALRLAGADRDD
jgi:crotonobetainyl-CoA:carnitine CoA-transferase CaiB-like acyl-CoA transferase